jgi:hypothetical protein
VLAISVYIGLALRWLLSLVLIGAGVGKLLYQTADQRRASVRNYRAVPDGGVALVALTLPCVELLLGALLAVGVALVVAASCTSALLGSFAVAVAWHLRAGEQFDCGCGAQASAIGRGLVSRDLGLAAAAGVVVFIPVGLAAWSGPVVDRAAVSGSELIPIPLMVVLVAALVRLLTASALLSVRSGGAPRLAGP